MSQFFPVDLHVHTPASKCYKGECSDDEYISIIRNYAERNVRIIAITDHNTLRGYKELLRIQDETKRDIKTLSQFASSSTDVANRISVLNGILDLFNKVLVLPGVEFESNPGIHLLFIFNPNNDLAEVERFLIESGYSEAEQGQENASNAVSIDVLQALESAKKIGAITIAAHADSDKGIYNDLKGNYRAKVFRSEYLDAISVNSQVNIDKIRNLFGQEQYRRNSPIAFIQSSDHHQQSDCAKMLTYVNMEKVSYSDMLVAFSNPDERISPTAIPETRQIISKIAQDQNTVCLDSFDERIFLQAACAILNSGYGVILIGVTNDQFKNIRGVKGPSIDIPGCLSMVKSSITPGDLYFGIRNKEWAWGNNVVIAFTLKNYSRRQFFYGGEHFHIENQNAVRSDYSFLITLSNNDQQVYDRINNRLFEELHSLSDGVLLLTEQKYAIPIIKRIESDGVLLSSIVDLNFIDEQFDRDSESQLSVFGASSGNIYKPTSFEQTRTEEYYVRITPYRLSKEVRYDDSIINKGPGIIVVPGGASFLVLDNECNIYQEESYNLPYLFLTLSDSYTNACLYSIIAWLKSSIYLWYSDSVFGSTDIYRPQTFNKVFIPVALFEKSISEQLEGRVRQIMEMEKEFLSQQETIIVGSKDADSNELIEAAKEHNSSVDVIANEIDQIINKCLRVKAEESSFLQHFLELKRFHQLIHK